MSDLEIIEVRAFGETRLAIACNPLDVQRVIDGITRYVSEHTELVPGDLTQKNTPYVHLNSMKAEKEIEVTVIPERRWQ